MAPIAAPANNANAAVDRDFMAFLRVAWFTATAYSIAEHSHFSWRRLDCGDICGFSFLGRRVQWRG
jgi:hypothetical protein